MIFIVRKMVKDYINANQAQQINGLDILTVCMLDAEDCYSIEGFIDQKVMENGQDAIGIIMHIVAKALEIDIVIHNIKPQEEKANHYKEVC